MPDRPPEHVSTDASGGLRRAVCRGLRFGVVSAALLAASVASGSGADQELWANVERLLADGIDNASEGDFDGAWASFRNAFVRGGASELVGLRRAAYCRREGCPRMPDLARLLGKPRSALDFLSGVCSDMTDHRCRRWAASLADGARYLGDEPACRAAPQELELRLWFAENGDPRPWVVVEVGDQATWAMVDTAEHRVCLEEGWARDTGADFEAVGRPYRRRSSDGEFRRHAEGVVRAFRMGTLALPRVAASRVSWPGLRVWFGMNILLRYDAVCFSWPQEPSGAGVLYLGTLGPCEDAEAADRAHLDPRTGQPRLAVALDDGTRIPALVDTGAIDTGCKEEFLARHGGDAGLRFGPHPALGARPCRTNPYPVLPHSAVSVRVGMTTLLDFKAFGWELDPFRMYFLAGDG